MDSDDLTSSRSRPDPLVPLILCGAVVMGMLTLALFTDEPSPSGSAPAFTCQDGDGSASCIPIQREGGAWDMVPVSAAGILGDGMRSGDRLVLLDPAVRTVEPTWIHRGKNVQAEFSVPEGAVVPVLMPDGSLAVARGEGDHLLLAQARVVAPSANPARPGEMVDAALAASR